MVTSLTNTAQSILTGAGRVNGVVINGGAAAEVVIFRATADTPEYFRYQIPIGASVFLPIRFFAEAGLEVITADAAGDVQVTVFFMKLSSPL